MSTDAPKAALITGASGRIGAAMARGLAGAGTAVVIHVNRSRDEGDALAATIRAAGGTAEVLQADLLDADAARQVPAEAAATLGRPLDLLVNNASIFEDDGPGDIDVERLRAHLDIHVSAPLLLSDGFAAQAGEGDGLIVNMIDQRVWRLTPRFVSYTASKTALWTLTRTLAQALAPKLRVNAIGPGPSLKNARQSTADFQAQIDALPLQRGPALEDFAATILYLWRMKSMTGQMIALDGGQHLAWQTPDVAAIVE
ncbi:MAG: SDR family oxidoreductase [Hyphomicrobiaceae bacterium]|nr:SDR family oxidoreductase [Hyphomicrobiaceae bacterium]